MAEVIADRIKWLIKERGTTQSAVADAIGLKQPSVGRLVSGETKNTGKLHELARALRTTPEFLVGETDDPEPPNATGDRRLAYDPGPAPMPAGRADRPDQVEVAEIDLRYGMGATYLEDNPEATPRTFSRAWLRNFTDSPPDELFWARGQGNSMEPEIREGDIVLIDRRQQTPVMADLIWAFAYGDTGMIKWLRPMPDGSIKIMSSNQSVRDQVAVDGELNIIGRVVAVVKKL